MTLDQLVIFHKLTHVMTIPVAILFPIWYSSRYGYTVKKGVSYSAVQMVIIVLFTYACKWVCDWLGYTIYINAARTFLFIPLFTLALSKLWKIGTLEGLDFLTPTVYFARTVVLIGCTSLGCGQAVACDWGVYSPNDGFRVFPMDLIDLIGTFTIGVISLIYAKKLQYKGNGRVFALSMICIGIVRHLIQFGSTDRYFGIIGLNDETIISVLSVIMGAIIFHLNDKNKAKPQ